MRVFVAVEVSEKVRRAVAERIAFLRERFAHSRVGWEKPEKLHLTLKFVGEIDERRASGLIAAACRAAREIAPFELTIENAGAFPPRGAPRVLWLGVTDETGGLRRLKQRLEDECSAIGFEPEKRDFNPHLTVARLKELHHSSELVRLHLATDFPAARLTIDEIVVLKSRLQPGGSLYTPLDRIKLKRETQQKFV